MMFLVNSAVNAHASLLNSSASFSVIQNLENGYHEAEEPKVRILHLYISI